MRVRVLLMASVVALGSLLSAQSGTGAALVSGSGSSGALTSTVIFAAHVHPESGGSALDLLVLLRGEPGWYTHTPRGGSVLTGASSNADANGRGTSTYWTSGGGFTVTFNADSAQPTLHLKVESSKGGIFFDDQVDTERTNVVLVDGVGGDDEPRIRTQRIDPRLSGDGSAAVLAIRRSLSLVNFVQCGLPLPADAPDAQGPLGRSLREAIARSCDEIRQSR